MASFFNCYPGFCVSLSNHIPPRGGVIESLKVSGESSVYGALTIKSKSKNTVSLVFGLDHWGTMLAVTSVAHSKLSAAEGRVLRHGTGQRLQVAG